MAEDRVVERGELVYPAIAKRAGVVGTVQLLLCVSGGGAVVKAEALDGHPMLRQAAIETIKTYRFRAGPEGPFRTPWEVVFSDGRSPSQVEIDRTINQQFFAREDLCREYLNSRNPEARKVCAEAVELSEKLPANRVLERSGAYEYLGQVQFAGREYPEALKNFEKALDLLSPETDTTAAEVAYAYRNVAAAHHVLRQPAEATRFYEKAEQQMQRALGKAPALEKSFGGITEVYARQLQEIREFYLVLLQQAGQTSAAADLEQRMRTGR